ncbi:MAG: N-acetylmuramoyl-L-alanine amidase [Dehalococcoidia bacterium]|nr:N-acetylmuramoyl-L-alanine amidase [Dehalococcoidia bacterium]
MDEAGSVGTTPEAGRLAGRRICLDPGHDNRYSPGASAPNPLGYGRLREQDLTLAVAYIMKPLLEAEGASVCVTRTESGDAERTPYDYNGNGVVTRPEDLPEVVQPCIDTMNTFGAKFMLSIHFNGHPDPSISGSEVYFSDADPDPDASRRYAQTLLGSLLEDLTAAGYEPRDRGVRSDRYKTEYRSIAPHYGFEERCSDCLRLLTLGRNPMSHEPGAWRSGALVEVLFLSNPQDAAFVARPNAAEIMAAGLAKGLIEHVAGEPR